MSILFLFIDGIGLGEPTRYNPFTDEQLESFHALSGGQGLFRGSSRVVQGDLLFTALDANLDMEGLPQSGTGQASLFSGSNASRLAGRHFGPYPHSRTRRFLETGSLFHQVLAEGFQPHFINAYPDIFFRQLEKRRRWTCTTLMAASAGQRLNRVEELREGRALTSCLTQESWSRVEGSQIESITKEEAAERFVRAGERYDLVMHEYFMTDKAGHSRSRDQARTVLRKLDRFIRHILKIKRSGDHLVICSDHGNLEDLSVKTHTRNPVPLIVQGPIDPDHPPQAESIMDLPGVIVQLLLEQSESDESPGEGGDSRPVTSQG